MSSNPSIYMDYGGGDHYERQTVATYACMAAGQSPCFGCGVGWTPAQSVTHSATKSAYAAYGAA